MNTAATPPNPQPNDLRRRLRELLSVPERDRTEEQWDEINELEIQLAPGNRISLASAPLPTGKTGTPVGGTPPQQPRKHNRAKTNTTRRPKPNKPPKEPAGS